MDLERTIVALGSGIAAGQRAIVRLSGQDVAQILRKVLDTPPDPAQPHPIAFPSNARLQLVPGHSQSIPVLCYWWPNEKSFTGQPCAELHLLGSLPIVENLIEACLRAGATMAERGDFTLRSFLAGKLDLTQAEAVLGVISADNEDELQTALGQLAGNLSGPVRTLRDEVLELTARLEAGLDFVEEDIEFISAEELVSALGNIQARLQSILDQLISRGGRSRIPKVVLVGLPNAGKSTLFNALLGSQRAIISSQAGTTRDALSAAVVWQDQSIELIDTAGIEELHEDSPRALAQIVLQERIHSADLIVFCIDLQTPPASDWALQQLELLEQAAPVFKLGTKADLSSQWQNDREPFLQMLDYRIDLTAADAIAPMRDKILSCLEQSTATQKSDAMHHTMLRCRQAIENAKERIAEASEGARLEIGEELVATELRQSIDDLSFVIGEIHTEDILGEIFSRFCIGK